MMASVKATIKGIRQSPRKVSLIAALVRGRSVDDALVILNNTPKRAAKPVAKAIRSAKANALSNLRVREDSLNIEHLSVTAGPRLKRMNPAARGQGLPYQKKTSHISVVLTGVEKVSRQPQTAQHQDKAGQPNEEQK